MHELFIAIGLILVIEGGLYAAFPGAMKRMMLQVLQLPEDALRMAGLAGATFGVGIVWAVTRLLA
jgi:uncharacterized protein YjeT (DUF2065 family)